MLPCVPYQRPSAVFAVYTGNTWGNNTGVMLWTTTPQAWPLGPPVPGAPDPKDVWAHKNSDLRDYLLMPQWSVPRELKARMDPRVQSIVGNYWVPPDWALGDPACPGITPHRASFRLIAICVNEAWIAQFPNRFILNEDLMFGVFQIHGFVNSELLTVIFYCSRILKVSGLTILYPRGQHFFKQIITYKILMNLKFTFDSCHYIGVIITVYKPHHCMFVFLNVFIYLQAHKFLKNTYHLSFDTIVFY